MSSATAIMVLACLAQVLKKVGVGMQILEIKVNYFNASFLD